MKNINEITLLITTMYFVPQFYCFLPIYKLHKPNIRTNSRTKLEIGYKVDNALEKIREKLETPSNKILEAVEKSPNFRLTVSQAASLSGLSLYESKKGLMTLSTLTGGDLEVTNQGDIIYSYPRNFRSILSQRSYGQAIKNFFKLVLPKLFYMIRIGVGIFLFASIILAATSLLIITSSGTSDRNDSNSDRDNRRRNDSISSYRMAVSINDIGNLFLRTNYGTKYQKSEKNFLEGFFSFIFGDGNPNENFSTIQFQEVAKLIEKRNGIVTAEEMATLLDPPTDPPSNQDNSYLVKESWVLPALIRFNGEPVVSETGEIYYKFEDLFSGEIRAMDRTSPTYLKEENISFSSLSGVNEYALVITLGLVNLFSVASIKDNFLDPKFVSLVAAKSAFLSFVSTLYPFMAIYAVAYFTIPAIRWFLVNQQNKEIQERNSRRQRWASYLLTQQMQKKIAIAHQIAVKSAADKAQMNKDIYNGIIYSTKDK